MRPRQRDKLISRSGQARKKFCRYAGGSKRKFFVRAIARRAYEISRRPRDRVYLLWKPSRAIANFRVAAQFGLIMTRAIEFFFAIVKNFFDPPDSQENRDDFTQKIR